MNDIYAYNFEELTALLTARGEPRYRAEQLFEWLHRRMAADFSEMSNLPKSFRAKLSEEFTIPVCEPVKILKSGIDGTRKYVFRLYDNNVIEAVLMRYHYGNSVCVSTQVGCRMGCRFCASTLDGLCRNLSASEILSEVYAIARDTGERVSHVVMMGSGEPLDNFDASVRFIRMLAEPHGAAISPRNVTLSTCGLVPRIYELAKLRLPITLALSLHASTQEIREEIMPIAKAYPLADVLRACRDYFKETGRRVSYEYSVVRGVNDSPQDALRLASILSGSHGHVNLIPVNPIRERDYRSPDRETVLRFQEILEKHGVPATIRREMGRDIKSACGQLRRSVANDAILRTD